MPDRAECEAVVRQLWPFVDGMGVEAERGIILDHLERCSDCDSHFDFARAFLEAVARSETVFRGRRGIEREGDGGSGGGRIWVQRAGLAKERD